MADASTNLRNALRTLKRNAAAMSNAHARIPKVFSADYNVTQLSNFLRALIVTLAGYVATAVAIAGAIIMAIPTPKAVGSSLRFSGDLLASVAWVILASGIALLAFQVGRLIVNKCGGRSATVFLIVTLLVMTWPTYHFLESARIGICGGKMLAMPVPPRGVAPATAATAEENRWEWSPTFLLGIMITTTEAPSAAEKSGQTRDLSKLDDMYEGPIGCRDDITRWLGKPSPGSTDPFVQAPPTIRN